MGGRIMVFPGVISDKEVRQSDYVTSNLILFGTKETNAIIEKFCRTSCRCTSMLMPRITDWSISSP
ncbi:MAG: hypothetical protein MZV63_70530 [Marinilabiliales bacterium]|nr:hypothetical protein [Marinilabiliales bacterium]